ncbi:DUF3307 domain-containing protein [Polymorphospora lycopeni]|uniref:DUF3307 domain-containing protein n=1 Tax=Polymorphospora lycopeni TaxID=3140240 RepID=A0ABV5CLH9_9ACTN
MTDVLAAFAAVFVTLYVAHLWADHWLQTDWEAKTKGEPGWRGWLACTAHCAGYTATAVVALVGLHVATGWTPDLVAAAVGLGISGGTHYVIDRRVHLRRLADFLGKDKDWLERGGGLYALDQSAHVAFLFVAALVIA